MRVIKLFIRRNIIRTFRNKAVVLVVAMMALLPAVMLLVLGKTWMIPILTSVVEDAEIAWTLLRTNIVAVMLSVASFTAPTAILGLVSEDFENKTIHNFLTAPIKRSHISYSYIISGVLFGLIINLIVLVIGQIFLFAVGDGFLGVLTIVKLLLFSILVLISLSTVFFYIMSGVKNVQASGVMTGMIGGFAPILGGVYIQLTMFPALVGSILNLLPFSHTLSILKRIVILPLVDKFALTGEVQEALFDSLTIDLHMFGKIVSPTISAVVIIASMLIFGVLNVLRFNALKKK